MQNQAQDILPFLDRLLQGEKVEWKPLGEVGTFTRGRSLQKKDFTPKGVGCIHYGQIYTYYQTFTYTTKSFVSYEFAQSARKAKCGDLVIATTSENDEDVCKAVAWLGNEDIAISSDACFYTHNMEPKYVAYYFQTEQFQKQKRSYITGAKVRRVNANDLAKILIPIPCPNNPEKSLAIQREIVAILDKFTQLEAELEAELDCRKRQYEYYRNQLLSFNSLTTGGGILDSVTIKKLREVGELVRGNGLQKKDLIQEGIPAIHYGQIYTHYGVAATQTLSRVAQETAQNLRKVNYGDVIITNTSENIEDVGKAVAYLLDEQGVTGGHATIFRPSKEIIGKFLVYYTQTSEFAQQKRKYAKGTKVIDVSANDLAKIFIPLPPLSEQQRIVAILDKFDALTNSISEGLPKEIALRRKQYEYYRERLLSFEHN